MQFRTIPLSSITVPEGRQRRDFRGIEELAGSLSTVGLINPLVIRRDGTLVAGERRLRAMRHLGWLEAPCQYTEEIDPRLLHLMELEENVKRQDLTWQEQNDAIARYAELLGEDKTQEEIGQALNIDRSSLSKHLTVAKERAVNPKLDEAEQFSTALSQARRAQDRRKASATAEVLGTALPALDLPESEEEETEDEAAPRRARLLNADFLSWEPDHPFNLLHCDFPYGVNTGDKRGQSAAKDFGVYDDSAETYFTLIKALSTKEGLVAESAHLIFWYSMKFHSVTVDALTAAGWRVDPFPLIWHKSDNAGIIPDAQRGPRRTYETALFASRGDRRIVSPVANSFSSPTTKQFHTSEKPYAMLRHFFRMLVDEHTIMLDPTCGSGMAVKAAEDAGAAYSLGLERDSSFYDGAVRNLGL